MGILRLRFELLPVFAITTAFLATAVLYPRLPDPMPIHWNAAGQPDGYASRLVGASLMPVTSLGLYLLLLILPRIDPRQANIKHFEGTYRLLRTGFTLFTVYFQIVILNAVLREGSVLRAPLVAGGLGVLFVLIGSSLPRVHSNWFLGIRTPWTLSSETVWRDTHRLGGKMFVVAGILTLLMALAQPAWQLPVLILVLLLAGLVPAAYSYFRYRQIERRIG